MLDPIGVVFQLKDQASAPLGKLQHQLEHLHGTSSKTARAFCHHAKQLGQGLSIMTSGALGLYSLRGIAQDATQFESSLTKMASAARASSKQVKQLSTQALQLGVAFEFSPEETLLGMKSLASAGLNVQQIMGSIPSALRLASAASGELSIPQAAETLTAAMKGYGKSVQDSKDLIDMLTKATQISNLRFGEFQEALGSAAGKSMVVNQSFETTVATLGLLRNTGLRALSAAEKLKMTLQTLIQPQAQQRAQALGIALRGPTGQLRQLDSIARDLIPKLNTLTQVEREKTIGDLFGFRSMEVYQAIKKGSYQNTLGQVFQGADALTAMRNELRHAQGTAQQFQDAFLGTTEGTKKLLEGAVQTLRIMLGRPLLQPLKKLNKALMTCVTSLLNLCEQSPDLCKMASYVVAIGSGFALVVGGVLSAKAALAMLTLAVGPLGTLMGGTVAMLLQATALTAGLGVAFYGVKKAFDHNLGGIKHALGGFLHKTALLLRTCWGFATQGGITDALKKQLDAAGLTSVVESLLRTVHRFGAVWQGLKQGFVEVFQTFKPLLNMLLAPLSTSLESVQRSLGLLTQGFDKAHGGSSSYLASLDKMKQLGRGLGVLWGSAAGGVAIFAARLASSIGLVAAGATSMVSSLLLLFTKGPPLWERFADSLIGRLNQFLSLLERLVDNKVVRFFLRNTKIPQAILSRMIPQDVGESFATPASPQSITPFTPLSPQSNTMTPLPVTLPVSSLPTPTENGPWSPQAMQEQQQQQAQQIQQLMQTQETLQQAMRDSLPQQTSKQPLQIQLMVDGRKMAQVVNQHNLRTSRRQGGQG